MTGWDTRADWQALPPRSVSHSIFPANGVTIHYVGGGQYTYPDHAACRRLVKSIQRWHLDNTTEGYVDIAYNLAACHHDVVLEARSTRSDPQVRPGSNGSASANQSSYGVVALYGDADGPPPDSLLRALGYADWWLRHKAGASSLLWPHSHWRQTSCPGGLAGRLDVIRRHADGKIPAPPPDPEPAPLEETTMPIMVKGDKRDDVYSLDPATGQVRHITYAEYQVRRAAGEDLHTVAQAVVDQLAP